jgi:hypothetical protein
LKHPAGVGKTMITLELVRGMERWMVSSSNLARG